MKGSKKSGWVRLHRQIEDNFLYFLEPFTKAQAWIDLFLNANHRDGVINIRDNIIPIKRGQIGWSEITMSRRWSWSRNKTRRFLKLLETEQQIKQEKSALTSIITILKYSDFQEDEQQTIQQRDNRRYNRRYTNNNDKNDKKEIITSFETEPEPEEQEKTKEALKKTRESLLSKGLIMKK